MSIVKVDNIHRSFGKVQAVRGLSFTIESGQVVGFIGANGAGKTTTMRMMVTLDVPDTGYIEVCNLNVLDHPREIRRLIGWMPDHVGAYPNMDVWEYLDFYGRAFGLSTKQRSNRLDDVMAFTDLDVLADRPCNGLSKGQTQRLCLGRALLSDPEVLVLDEPAAGLDPKARIEFKNLVKLLAQKGKTLFISSHILSELGEMCDHLLFIDNGRQVHSGTSDSLRYHMDAGQLKLRMSFVGDRIKLEKWVEQNEAVSLLGDTNGSIEILVDEQAGMDPNKQQAEILRSMLDAGIEVYAYNRIERRLEDAFIDLLGKEPS